MDSNARKQQYIKNSEVSLSRKDKQSKNTHSLRSEETKISKFKPYGGNIDNSYNKNIQTVGISRTNYKVLNNQPNVQYNQYRIIDTQNDWPGSSQQNYNNFVFYSVPSYVSVIPSTPQILNPYSPAFLTNTVGTPYYIATQIPTYSYNSAIPHLGYEKVKTHNTFQNELRGLHQAKFFESSHQSDKPKEIIKPSNTNFVSQGDKKLSEFYSTITQFYSCKDPINYINSLKGSRHVQKLLQKNEAEAFILYEFIKGFKNEVIYNVYGNYVIKKIFSLLKVNQRKEVWKQLEKDLISYSQNIHASHSMIMLISKSESEPETEEIERAMINVFSDLVSSEPGTNILAELVSKLNFTKKNVRLVNYICDSIGEVLQSKSAVVLCKKLITRLGEEGNNRLYSDCLLKALILHFLKMSFADGLNDLLFQVLDDWSLEQCLELTRIFDSKFSLLAKASISSPMIIKYLSILELKVRSTK